MFCGTVEGYPFGSFLSLIVDSKQNRLSIDMPFDPGIRYFSQRQLCRNYHSVNLTLLSFKVFHCNVISIRYFICKIRTKMLLWKCHLNGSSLLLLWIIVLFFKNQGFQANYEKSEHEMVSTIRWKLKTQSANKFNLSSFPFE